MSAYLSACGRYRYSLTRDVAPLTGEGTVTFIGLNPSTADATTDDPTIRRCVRFARDWGFARLKMVNLYAYRATKPADLWLADDPVGPENDHVLSLVFGGSDLVVAAWGANARSDRLASFDDTFRGWPLLALGVTKDGAPRHPLYVKADTVPVPFAHCACGGLDGVRTRIKSARASRRGMPSAQPETPKDSGGAVSREGET